MKKLIFYGIELCLAKLALALLTHFKLAGAKIVIAKLNHAKLALARLHLLNLTTSILPF
jgi:hypothetical protein